MKKIMLAVAVVCAAVMAQAAQVNWTVTNSRLPVLADLTKSYSGIQTTASDTAMAMTISLLYAGETLASETTSATGMFSGKMAMDQAKTIEITTAAGSNSPIFDVIASVTTADGVYSYAGTVSANLGNVVSGAKNVPLSINMNNAGTWSFTPNTPPEPTPEPTSALLMVFGMASLALRRRRA